MLKDCGLSVTFQHKKKSTDMWNNHMTSILQTQGVRPLRHLASNNNNFKANIHNRKKATVRA